uniref:Retrotransposon gag domain-containing protein n=1 Tax=Cajanus cajan TaxID=3821 RepID=A0A151S088_CAJCA|nr:hypothetical protein KK1_030115 [Cajanus cajan]
MDGPALSWFQWMFRNGFITSWPALLQVLETRFAPSFYDDPKGMLFKISQHGSVNEYLIEFERLANRIVGVAPPFLLSCFVFGLTPEFQREVQALQPILLPQATALAKLQEDKLNDCTRPIHKTTQSSSSTTLAFSASKLPFKHLTLAELASSREKGLCYNCNEKFSSGHRCKGSALLLIADDTSHTTSDLDPLFMNPQNPADTTWEKWDDLQSAFKLEDKLLLPAEGNDSNPIFSVTPAHDARPKRHIRRPSYLNDLNRYCESHLEKLAALLGVIDRCYCRSLLELLPPILAFAFG